MEQANANPGSPTDMPTGAPVNESVSKETPAGDYEQARAQTVIARKSLETVLAVFGSETDEGKAVLDAIKAINKGFGNTGAGELVPTETANMVSSLPAQDLQAIAPEIMNAVQPAQGAPPELAGAAEGGIPPELTQNLQM